MTDCVRRSRATRLLRRRLWRHPIYVWVLWAAAALVLAACPMMLSDPAMWPYLLDPELLALVVVIGARFTMLQIELLRARVMAGRFGRSANLLRLGPRRLPGSTAGRSSGVRVLLRKIG